MDITGLIGGIALLTTGAFVSPNGYVEAGVAYHSNYIDSPEITGLGYSIFEYETGWKFKNTSIYYRHSSGITTTEQGAGFNVIGLKVRLK